MPSKPAREHLGLPIRQQIHNTVSLQIDQDRSIAMTAPPAQSSTARTRIETDGRIPNEHLSSTRRQIAKLANVTTVHALGDQTTRRAPRRAVRIRIKNHLIGRDDIRCTRRLRGMKDSERDTGRTPRL